MHKFYLVLSFIGIIGTATAQQGESIDKVVGVVGNSIVLYSDVMGQYAQLVNQGATANESLKCSILDQLLTQKLLYNQAVLDSIVVPDAQVEDELSRRVRYFTSQFGSQDKLEEFLGKSLSEFKEELRGDIRELLLAQQMQQTITKNSSITPTEVKRYFNSLPADSLPYYNTEVEIGQLVKYPIYNEQAEVAAREKLEAIRVRVQNGEDLSTMAILYSQDPGSARAGGELGFVGRGDLVKAFEAVAFKLKPGELSPVVETEYGFHIIQPIERRGEQVNVRHILIKPEIQEADYAATKKEMDSIYTLLITKKIEFGEAAAKFSDDARTKNTSGMLLSPADGSTKITTDQLDAAIFLVIDTLKIGTFSQPVLYQSNDGKRGFRIIYYKSKTEPHRANLTDDYQKIQTGALAEKESKVIAEWFREKRQSTYVRIDPMFLGCDEIKPWIKKSN